MNEAAKNAGKQVNARLRQGEALRLRAEGKTFRQIADALGFAGPSGAFRSVSCGLRDCQHEGVSELRALHSLRLSEIVASLWARVKKGDPQAARAVITCLERESKLYGLDAPSQIEIGRLLASEDWQNIRGVIVAALADEPTARAKVAEALRGLDGD